MTFLLLLAMAPAYGFKDSAFKDSAFKDSGFKDGGFKDSGFKDSSFTDGGLKGRSLKSAAFKNDAACPEGARGVRCQAEQGQANFQFEWGMMLLDGDGVERDHMGALMWLSRAAKQGHGTAGYILARLSLSSEPGGVCAR